MIPSLPSTAVRVTFTVTPFYNLLAQALDRWLRTLGPVSNEGHAYVKNQTALHSESAPHVTWPTPLKCYDSNGTWEGVQASLRGISLAQQWPTSLSLITLSCYRPWTRPQTRMATHFTPEVVFYTLFIVLADAFIQVMVVEYECINFKHGWPQWETIWPWQCYCHPLK